MEHYKIISKKIKGSSTGNNNSSLSDGFLGASIFYYRLREILDDKNSNIQADLLLDRTLEVLEDKNVGKGFLKGISGIGWGIEYLLKNKYVEGDRNEILADIDDQLFQLLAFPSQANYSLENGLLGYGFYYLQRLQDNDDKEISVLLYSILDKIINKLCESLEAGIFPLQEPSQFRILWDLPFLIFFLSECYRRGFLEKKILYMFQQLSGSVLCSFPYTNSNKLFLGLALDSIPKVSSLERWHKHAQLILDNIEYRRILEEVRMINPSILNGLSGLLMLLLNLSPSRMTTEANETALTIYKKLLHFVAHYDDLEKKIKMDNSILKGWTGIGFALLCFEKKHPNLISL